MFISVAQIESSLKAISRLSPFFGTIFLAFKKAELPIGKAVAINFTKVVDDLVRAYYSPRVGDDRYFLPFITSKAESRWRSPLWASKSGQRIAKDAFGDVFEHPSGRWGWKRNYV